MSPIVQIGNHIASALVTFGILIVVSGGIAFFVARRYGGRSRAKRRAIYTVVGAVGLVAAAGITIFRLRGPL